MVDLKQKENNNNWNFARWADEANDRFVGFARALMQIVNGDLPITRNIIGGAPKEAPHEEHATSTREQQPTQAAQDPPMNEEVLTSLADRINRTLDRSLKNAYSFFSGRSSSESEQAENSIRSKYRDLFHHQTERRISAVRYFAEVKNNEAIPLLEGIFAIEEDEDVRREIVNALHDLRADKSNGRDRIRSSETAQRSI